MDTIQIDWKKVWKLANEACSSTSCYFGVCSHEKKVIREEVLRQLNG